MFTSLCCCDRVCTYCIVFVHQIKMRTSHLQYITMVEFMEANGDLSKPSGGPRGRHFIQKKGKELSNKLNSDGSGDPRSKEKWRKVWSDFKNNCKKKCAQINRAASGTGGGPALQLSLTDLENRVMQIIGVQATTGLVVEEAGFQLDGVSEVLPSIQEEEGAISDTPAVLVMDWNTPGTSSQPTVAPPSPPTVAQPPSPSVAAEEEEWRPPQKKMKKDLTRMFVESDTKAREHARERERIYDEFERKRLNLRKDELRLREYECKERVRLRDLELQLQVQAQQLQAQWMQFMKEAMEVLVKILEKK